jgi:hypothetical protein
MVCYIALLNDYYDITFSSGKKEKKNSKGFIEQLSNEDQENAKKYGSNHFFDIN